jgi:hypothetical protein
MFGWADAARRPGRARRVRTAGVCGGASLAAALAIGTIGATEATAGGQTVVKSGPLRYVTNTSSVGATDDGGTITACPGGSRLAGGGGSLAGPTDEVRLGGIFPLDFFDPGFVPDDAYAAEGYNNSAAPRAMRSVAVCLRNASGGADLDYVTGDGPPINMGSSVGTGASATCASGRVIGGGLQIPGPATTQFEEQLNSTRPSDNDLDGDFDGWRGSLNVNMSTVARTPRAVAVCQPPGDYRLRYRFTSKIVFPDTAPTLKTKCPAGKGWRVTGGGIQGFFSRIRASVPFDDKDRKKVPDDGWRGSITTSSGADPAALLVHAICIKPI